MSEPKGTQISEILPELNAGVFEGQINRALSDIAMNVLAHGKKGELTIKLKLSQIGDSNQVKVTHALTSVCPTKRGRVTEETAQETPLHVGSGGKLMLYPTAEARQMDLGAGAATGARA